MKIITKPGQDSDEDVVQPTRAERVLYHSLVGINASPPLIKVREWNLNVDNAKDRWENEMTHNFNVASFFFTLSQQLSVTGPAREDPDTVVVQAGEGE
jgi:hypothetical protein